MTAESGRPSEVPATPQAPPSRLPQSPAVQRTQPGLRDVQPMDAPEQPPPRVPQPTSEHNGGKPPAAGRPSFGGLAARFGWVALLIALDQYSKASVFEWLGQRPQGMVRDACGHDRWRLAGEIESQPAPLDFGFARRMQM